MTQPLGLLIPFQRDGKSDFAAGSGEPLRRAHLHQTLQTRRGEMAWGTERGSLLHLLRHTKQDAATLALARIYVSQVIKNELPNERIDEICVRARRSVLEIYVAVIDHHGSPMMLSIEVGDPDATQSPQ